MTDVELQTKQQIFRLDQSERICRLEMKLIHLKN